MLVTVQKGHHVALLLKIRDWGTIFTEIYFGVSKEWVRFKSHIFLITKLKSLAKKLLAVRPEKVTKKEKKKRPRMAIAKLFALNINAKKGNFRTKEARNLFSLTFG